MKTNNERRLSLEATNWLILLREEPGDETLRRRFEAWMDAHEAHRAAWNEAQHLWGAVGEAYDTLERLAPRPTLASLLRDYFFSRRRLFNWRRLTASAAVIGAAAAVLSLVVPEMLARWEADYVTGVGEMRQLTLEDGTLVFLRAESAVSVEITPKQRRAKLIYGEAYFRVADDARRPFQVNVGNVDAEVQGDADLRKMPEGALVAVQNGLANVAFPKQLTCFNQRLENGDWARVNWSGDVRTGQESPDEVAIWMKGALAVKNWTIGEVVRELRHFHRGLIVLGDSQLAERRVSGMYDLTKPIETLDEILKSQGGRILQITPFVIVVLADS